MRDKRILRAKRKKSIRKKIFGSAERPRLTVFKSSKHIYAQLINDETGTTLAAASTLTPSIKEKLEGKSKSERAALVGKLIAEMATAKGYKKVVYDRNGYIFHGRVKVLADAARESGLDF
jgi:large subunit ribosomal protein L18